MVNNNVDELIVSKCILALLALNLAKFSKEQGEGSMNNMESRVSCTKSVKLRSSVSVKTKFLI